MSKEQVQRFMDQAIDLAIAAADQDEVPVGAVIVREQAVIATGQNRKESQNNPLGHAELEAIKQACSRLENWRLTDCTVFVTLEPCPMCLAALQQARVAKVVFAARDPKGGALSLGYDLHKDRRLNHSFEMEFFQDERSARMLSEFFRLKRKRK